MQRRKIVALLAPLHIMRPLTARVSSSKRCPALEFSGMQVAPRRKK